MTDSSLSEPELQRTMQHVQEAVVHRRRMLEAVPWQLPRMAGSPRPWVKKDRYELRDFLEFHDAVFLNHAYRALLIREPDPQGFEGFLGGLRAGELSRTNIVGRLRYSAEGRAIHVPVDHLALPFALALLGRVPIIGHVLHFMTFLRRLPAMVGRHERMEGIVEAIAAGVEANATRDQERLTFAISMLSEALATQARGKAERASLDQVAETVSALTHELGEAISQLQQEKAEHAQVEALRDLATELRAAVNALSEGKADRALVKAMDSIVGDLRSRLDEAERAGASYAAGQLDDGFYTAFEEHFRGTREDIKRRVAEHLPTIVSAGAGRPDAPVLDLGCGRGEWLEVLSENGFVARGLDLNGVTVASCARSGLDVIRAEALEHLRGLPAAALGAVTAFHMIEHLPFTQLVALLDETRRVLRPGGVVLFETPNPENLIVGACNFWLDPTHVKPLPPELMQFVCESRGFVRCEVQRLHPVPYDRHLSSGAEQVRRRLNELLYGWQDYAVAAYKA